MNQFIPSAKRDSVAQAWNGLESVASKMLGLGFARPQLDFEIPVKLA